MAVRPQPSDDPADHPGTVHGPDVTEERLVTAVLRGQASAVTRPGELPTNAHPGLYAEPDRRRLEIGQQAEAQGIGQQLTLESWARRAPSATRPA